MESVSCSQSGDPALLLSTPWAPTQGQGNCLDVGLAGHQLESAGAILPNVDSRDHMPVIVQVCAPKGTQLEPSAARNIRQPIPTPRTNSEIRRYRRELNQQLERAEPLLEAAK